MRRGSLKFLEFGIEPESKPFRKATTNICSEASTQVFMIIWILFLKNLSQIKQSD